MVTQVPAPRPVSRLRRRWVKVVVSAAVVTVVGVAAVTADALSAPGSDPAAAKLAEWARDHGLGRVVTTLEAWRYAHDQPAEGGEPDGGIPAGRRRVRKRCRHRAAGAPGRGPSAAR